MATNIAAKKVDFIHVRLKPAEHEILLNRMRAQGYSSKTAFLRDLTLKDDLSTQKQLSELKQMLQIIMLSLEVDYEKYKRISESIADIRASK